MAGKKIFIEYDIDSSDLKIAGQDTLSLTQQLRVLKKELQRGDLQPEQFDILRKKIGDTEDRIAKTTVKSKDFFSVLSTLPGPVGQFASAIQQGIDLLKTFSSFTFKDIKNSLNDVADDVVEITDNFRGLDNQSRNTANANKELSESNRESSQSFTEQAAQIGQNSTALEKQTREQQKSSQAVTEAVKQNRLYIGSSGELLTAEENIRQSRQGGTETIQNMTAAELADVKAKQQNANATLQSSAANQTATVTTNTLTTSTNLLTGAVVGLRTAWNALKLAFGGLVIGAVIIALTEGVTWLYQWITGTEEAEAENKKLTKSFDELKKSIDSTQESLKIQTDLAVLSAKVIGKSEEEIFKITKEGLGKRVTENEKAKERILNQLALLKVNARLSEEDRLKQQEELQGQFDALGERGFNLRIEGEKMVLNEELRIADKRRAAQKEANDKRISDQKQAEEKRKNDAQKAEEQLDQLVDEISVLRVRDERARQFQQLEIQKKNEEEKIKALEISKEKEDEVLTKLNISFRLKQEELQDKFDKEDIAALKEFNRKKEDIQIQSIENVKQREQVERQVALNRELEDLEKDKNFILLSEEQKEEIRKNIRQKYRNEENELIKSDRLKALDDELRFLQIRQEAIRANTQAFFDGQRDILDASEQREIELAEGKENEILAIQEKYFRLRKDLRQQEFLATVSAVGETIGALASLSAAISTSYDIEAEDSKKAFDQRKKLQIATASISAASGIIQILSQPSTLPSPFDWITKGINAAALGVTTAVQIAKIKNTEFEGSGGQTSNKMGRGYANGGLITGPGTSTSDSIPARLSNGEAVMTAGAVTMFAPMLSMMNQMGGGTSFSNQVSNTLPDRPSMGNASQEPVIMKTYVVESELTSSQQRQARLKNLSTL